MLAPENVDRQALMEYARDAADFATNYQLPSLDFAVNHYGQADVAMFDFTSMYAAENACRIMEKRGHKLLQGLVGDSLLEVIHLSSLFVQILQLITLRKHICFYKLKSYRLLLKKEEEKNTKTHLLAQLLK